MAMAVPCQKKWASESSRRKEKSGVRRVASCIVLLSFLAGLAGDQIAELLEVLGRQIAGLKQMGHHAGSRAAKGAIDQVLEHAAEGGALLEKRRVEVGAILVGSAEIPLTSHDGHDGGDRRMGQISPGIGQRL